MITNLRPSRRVIGLTAALLASGLLATGCSSAQQAGSAATLGSDRITEQQLTTQVQSILAAQRQPVDTANATLTAKTLSRMITIDLVNTLALRKGIVITQGDIDQQLSTYDSQVGGRDQVIKTFAEQDIAPNQIEAVVRLNLQAQQLGIELDPHGSAEEQGKAVFNAVNELSDELDVTSSPRFGSWDALTLSVSPNPNDLSALPAQN